MILRMRVSQTNGYNEFREFIQFLAQANQRNIIQFRFTHIVVVLMNNDLADFDINHWIGAVTITALICTFAIRIFFGIEFAESNRIPANDTVCSLH